MSEFVDANIFVRLLTRDDPQQSRRSLALFQRAERGEVELMTSEAVVAEVVYVLASPVLYATPRPEVAARLGAALVNKDLRLDHKESVLLALDRYGTTNLHFADCLCVEHAQREALTGIYSYDQDLDRVPGVRRLEP